MNQETADPQEPTRRIELLERENRRLRQKVESLFGPETPNFDLLAFRRGMQFYMLRLWLGVVPLMLVAFAGPWIGIEKRLPGWRIGPLPLVDLGSGINGHPGLGLGIIAAGGLACGGIAIGGQAVGLIAIGGGAIGGIAIGGGALGIIAIGGGAVGYIAGGGGAAGYYCLADQARGRFIWCRRRQDPEAIRFFGQYLPRLRRAVTNPLPVEPVDPTA